MKTLKLILAAATVIMTISSCMIEGTAPSYSNVSVYSRTYNQYNTSQTFRSATNLAGSDLAIQSIRVTSTRVLISRLMLHVEGQPDAEDNRLVIAGPIVLRGYDSSPSLLARAQLTTNQYDAVKFELHRFQPNELSVYAGDTAFSVFATPERYSVVIQGLLNDSIPFAYYTDITANLTLPFDNAIVVNDAGMANIELQFNSLTAFSAEGYLLDPRLPANKILIDNQLRTAFRASKL